MRVFQRELHPISLPRIREMVSNALSATIQLKPT